ncbi:RHS repeat-associated core domain-containing protein [Nannocystaceae bacterium ST9]
MLVLQFPSSGGVHQIGVDPGSYASNATTTTYEYDPLNFRLRALETTRSSDNAKLQGLHYHYDPVGNVTDIRDDAQQTVYFQNAIVEAANSYTYDALYRLVEATGREHATQGTAQRSSTQLLPDSSAVPMANDPNALRRYTQSYTYDAVGNLETVVHTPASGTGWTRRYQYREDGNRLVATSAPGDSAGALYTNTATYSHTYPHDVHGNFTAMPHMSAMEWDELEQLHHCTVGSLDVHFQYAGGVRVRKYVEHGGSTREERIYLGTFEVYRKHVNGVLEEEWESLHISDDTGRIVLVETHTVADGSTVGSPTGIWRFQLSDHLGSAATEVTETGAIISYEEYHPYGTSAYRLQDSQIDVPVKRYRYTGMERDEETGLGYHTARYYAPWLGRWTSADPIGLGDGPNRYSYVRGNPIRGMDPSGTSEIEVQAQQCDATCREETIATYKEERQRTREEYMTAYSEWMRLYNSPGNAERVQNARDLYSKWKGYGQAISDMERQHAELLETERGASQILGSNKVIAAAAIIGTSAAAAYLLTAALGGGFVATVVGGGVDGGITGGGLSAVDGNDAEQVWEDTKTGGAWGIAFGGLGYGVSWGFGKTVSWIRSPKAVMESRGIADAGGGRVKSAGKIKSDLSEAKHTEASQRVLAGIESGQVKVNVKKG